MSNVVIPYSVKSIGNYAFLQCSGLTEIDIPNSVESIGLGTFEGCDELVQLSLPFIGSNNSGNEFTKLIYIFGNYAYSVPASLKTVIVKSGTEIPSQAFKDCEYIETIILSDSITKYGSFAFFNCESLTDFTISNNVTDIDNSAFGNCESLTEIVIPENVTRIGSEAFWGCTALKYVFLERTALKGITDIEVAAFGNGQYGCPDLEMVCVPDKDSQEAYRAAVKTGFDAFKQIICYATPGLQFSLDTSTDRFIVSVGNDGIDGKVVIPNTYKGKTVGKIGNNAFGNCTGLIAIELPTTVTWIDSYAFSGCVNLSDITLSDSVSKIGEYAFKDCTALTTLDIPNQFINVDDNVFEGSGITNIVRLRYIFTEGILEVSNTFRIRLVFDNDPVGLTVNNITINGSSTGKLSGSGTERILELYNVTQQTLAVKVFGLPDAVIINGVKNAYIQSMSNVEYADVCVLLPYRGDYYADILYALEEKLILDERNLCVLNAEGNEYMQRDQLQTLIDLNKDTIILWEVFPGALNDLISEARQRGIRVLVFSWMEIETEADCLVMYDYYLAGYEMGYYLYEHGYESESNRIELFAANYDLYYTGFQSFLMGLNQAISENSNELEVVIHTLEDDGEIFQECYQIIVTHGIPCAVISFNDKFTEEIVTCFSSYLSNITIFALTEDTNNLKLVEFGQINAVWYLGCEHIAETIMQFHRGDIEDDIYYLPFVKVDNVNMSDFVE